MSLEDPPPPPVGVPQEEWDELLECIDLAMRICTAELMPGIYDPSRIPGWTERRNYLVAKYGDRVRGATEALRQWRSEAPLRALAKHRLHRSDSDAWRRYKGTGMLFHRRRQFPVGQGGFHLGSVSSGQDRSAFGGEAEPGPQLDFRYVYDCGSEPRSHVDRAITGMVGECPNQKLDMLFLSHFDRDHMCGIPKLLGRRGVRVDTIVLPHVDHVERLVAFARFSATTNGGKSSFFERMVVDPVDTLSSFGPRLIVLVEAEDDEMAERALADPPRGPAGAPSWQFEGGTYRRIADGDNNATTVLSAFGGGIGLPGAIEGGWRLVPYVQRADRSLVAAFEHGVELLLGWDRGSFRRCVADLAARHQLVTKHRTNLARVYEHVFGNKNLTSLCLYSGPDNPLQAGAVQIEPHAPPAERAKIGWIGTGDADLRSRARRDAFELRYFDELPFVQTFMLPHHGSIHSSDPDNLLSSAEFWVAAAEPTHSDRKHPAVEIVDKVTRSGALLKRVTSCGQSQFDEALAVFWTE